MQDELQSALDILDDYQGDLQYFSSESQTELMISEANSLLARCEQVVNDHMKSSKPKIRIIHHLACSGGTLFTKCIASLPNVYVISEVHPKSTLHIKKNEYPFSPSDIITLSRFANIPHINELARKVFIENIRILSDHVSKLGGRLVLRDHTHTDFFVGANVEGSSVVASLLSDRFDLLRLASIRDPIDSYLSLVHNGWDSHKPQGFEEYCRRVLHYISEYPLDRVIKYEDFLESPTSVLSRVAKLLELPDSETATDIFSIMNVTGDSGRTGDEILPRKRRVLDEEQSLEINESTSYKKICELIGY